MKHRIILLLTLILGLYFVRNVSADTCVPGTTSGDWEYGKPSISISNNNPQQNETVNFTISFPANIDNMKANWPVNLVIHFGGGAQETKQIPGPGGGISGNPTGPNELQDMLSHCSRINPSSPLVNCSYGFETSYTGNDVLEGNFQLADAWNPNYSENFCITVQKNVVPAVTCGDGVINGNEKCEGTNLNNQTCQTIIHTPSFTGGALVCDANCEFDITHCTTTEPTVPTGYKNPLIWQNILEFLGYILVFIFNIGIGLSILMILIGAFVLATSQGDPYKAEKAKKIIMWAMIGFITTMLANGIIVLLKTILGVKQ